MTARIGTFLVGLVLILQPLSGSPILQAAPPQQSASQGFTAPPGEPIQDRKEPGVFVEANGTVVNQSAGCVQDEPSFAPDACDLPAPTLISPVGGAQINTLAPFFQWSGLGAMYRIQIATGSDFSVLIHDGDWQIGGSSHHSILMHFNLSPNTSYYWRVASRCSDYSLGRFSSAASFSTADVTGPFPNPPSMIAPANGASQSSPEVTFSWGDVPDAMASQVRIYDSLTEAQSDDQWHQKHSLVTWSWYWSNSTTYTFWSTGTYYWRVGAATEYGWGPLSPVWSFTIGSQKVYLPVIRHGG
jgi:hypothetical protein